MKWSAKIPNNRMDKFHKNCTDKSTRIAIENNAENTMNTKLNNNHHNAASNNMRVVPEERSEN